MGGGRRPLRSAGLRMIAAAGGRTTIHHKLGLLLHFLVNAAALAIATFVVPGIHAGGWGSILAIALVFGLVNVLIRPIVKLLSCPMIVLTLGLFSLIVNALM